MCGIRGPLLPQEKVGCAKWPPVKVFDVHNNWIMSTFDPHTNFHCPLCLDPCLDLGVGSIKSTLAFQVGSSRFVVASPSKFSGAVGFITIHFKSTWPKDVDVSKLAPSRNEFGQIRQFITYFTMSVSVYQITVYGFEWTDYQVSVLRTALIVRWRRGLRVNQPSVNDVISMLLFCVTV